MGAQAATVQPDRNRIILIRHDDGPDDDFAYAHLRDAGFRCEIVRPFKGEALPRFDEGIRGSVIYGGPFNVFDTDRHPFLNDEYRWIGESLAAERPLLGICQGAQQIAWHLGAAVGPTPDNRREFGLYPIEPTDEAGSFLDGPLWVTQNHFHTFELPVGATLLAGSALFPNQAFRIGGQTYALQFHPEVSRAGFTRWQNRDGAYDSPVAQGRDEQNKLFERHAHRQVQWFAEFLSDLFDFPSVADKEGNTEKRSL